jgi:hypothetical protein
VRTGNTSHPSSNFKNEEGKYTVLGNSSIVNFNITNCLFDADLDEGEVLEGNDKGVIGIHVTSERSTVVVKNSTIIAPQPIYITTSLRNYTEDVIRGNDVVTVIDSILDNSDKTPNSKPDAIYCGEDFATVNDDPTVENGYQEP